MIIINAFKDSWNNDYIREFEIGGVPIDRSELTSDEFLAELRAKRVLLLVHGYNNLHDDVLRAYGIIEKKIRTLVAGHYDMVIGFTWSGGDDPLDYFAAKRVSSAVAPRLRSWLAKIKPEVDRLDVMTHSMGSRVLLSALESDDRVDNAFNMASAVDNECLEPSEKYYKAAKNCKNFYVFHTLHDVVLSLAYSIAEWDQALGYSGPEDVAAIAASCPQVKVANCKHVVKSHGAYKNTDEVYQHIDDRLAGNNLPQFVTL